MAAKRAATDSTQLYTKERTAMIRLAIGLVVVTLAGCTFPATKMEPVGPTGSAAAHSADKKGASGSSSSAR
jgi:hypothetical protein